MMDTVPAANCLGSRWRQQVGSWKPIARLARPRGHGGATTFQAAKSTQRSFPAVVVNKAHASENVTFQQTVRSIGEKAVVLGASALLLLCSSQAVAEETLRFPASPVPQVFAAQKTLVEAWTIVNEAFVDGTFNNHDWEKELSSALTAAYLSEDGDKAYLQIEAMLDKLNDPFTRIISPQEYADFRVSSDGEVQGVGLLIAADSASGKLVVLQPIKGGPAEKAGMLPGDEVVSINGESTQGWDGERAAKILRGKQGSAVTVKFARRTDQIPGVPGRPEERPQVVYKQVHLKRAAVELSPVYATVLHNVADHPVGYIRLVNFSQHAADDMRVAIMDLKKQNVEGFILDLRNNPGGLVRAGLDVARLWLDGAATVFNVAGRVAEDPNEQVQQEIKPESGNLVRQQVMLNDGMAVTHKPLTILVNSMSASASEILAGALRDNARAELIGTSPTFGKGKIQSVFELEDGSALFVTVAKYKTPHMEEIDKIGINPDKLCAMDADGFASVLPPGIPVGPGSLERWNNQLENDSCVLTAETELFTKFGGQLHSAPAIASLATNA